MKMNLDFTQKSKYKAYFQMYTKSLLLDEALK